jgi:hypothetical protein
MSCDLRIISLYLKQKSSKVEGGFYKKFKIFKAQLHLNELVSTKLNITKSRINNTYLNEM